MKGNLAVLTILGLFLIGAIWISVWAPSIAPKNVSQSTQSWISQGTSQAPWDAWDAELKADLDTLEDARLAELRGTDDAKERRAINRKYGFKETKNKRTKQVKLVPLKKGLVPDAHATVAKKKAAWEKRGGKLFAEYCASCHGDKGEGDGFAAEFLPVPPRNFKIGKFRFKTTPEGSMPTDGDLFRTVSLGAMGTPMPGWSQLLSVEERWATIAYMKTLSPNWKSDFFQYSDRPVATVLGPPTGSVAALTAVEMEVTEKVDGKEVKKTVNKAEYLYLKNCEKCHGVGGLGDGPSAPTLKDSSGTKEVPMDPRNFHRPWEFKRGRTIRDIAFTIATGLNGTPMPSHLNTKDYDATTLKRHEIWAVAAHVVKLSKHQPNFVEPRFRDPGLRLGRPDVYFTVRERAWLYEVWDKEAKKWAPLSSLTVEQGRLVQIKFQPTDNGLGFGQGLAISGYESSVYITSARVDRPATVTFRAWRDGTFRIYNPTQSAPGHVLAKMTGDFKVAPAKDE